MAKAKKPQFGELPPRYSFVLNPYPDMRVSRCPHCERKTGQRKLPLLIHVEPAHLIALNYTCRYCNTCDLLIADKQAIEHLLTGMFSQHDPEVVGNEYLIIGTVEKKLGMRDYNSQNPSLKCYRMPATLRITIKNCE
jgi:hypothetical protein